MGDNCSKCKKDVGGFFGAWGYYNDEKYCKECLTKVKIKAEKNEQSHKQSKTKKTGSIEEIKCTCNQCGHTWHYLPREKRDASCQSSLNTCMGCAACGSFMGWYSLNKAHDYRKHAEAFDKCPKCGSRNFKKESHYYD